LGSLFGEAGVLPALLDDVCRLGLGNGRSTGTGDAADDQRTRYGNTQQDLPQIRPPPKHILLARGCRPRTNASHGPAGCSKPPSISRPRTRLYPKSLHAALLTTRASSEDPGGPNFALPFMNAL